MKVLSIIIPTHNRVSYLRNLLLQISNQKPIKLKVYVIVVNAGSVDGTAELLHNFDFNNIILVNGKNDWWFTRCVNEGILKAMSINSDYILILNDDTEIKNTYLSTLWDDYLSLNKSAILGSASISINPSDLIDFSGTKSINFLLLRTKTFLPKFNPLFEGFIGIHETWTLNGRGTFLPIEIVNRLGLFDNNLKQYGSDYEYIIRAKKLDVPVFISWNSRVYNNLYMTSDGATFKNTKLLKFLQSFINPYSINSISKASYIFWKHGYRPFIFIYLVLYIIGTTKSYLKNRSLC